MTKHELNNFFEQISQEIQSEYDRIRPRVHEDPGTAGDQGEENWLSIFKEWLPQNFHYVTKGRILNEKNEASPQIDLLVLHPDYPKKLLDKKLYLSGGVIAAFECKITLRDKDIEKCIENAKILRDLLPIRKGTIYKEMNSPIIYGVLAHSSEFKNKKPNFENISEKLHIYGSKTTKHPKEMIDFVCVADLGLWEAHKSVMMIPEPTGKIILHTTSTYMMHSKEANPNVNVTPIGALIADLSRKISWTYPSYRAVSQYFNRVRNTTNSSGLVASGRARIWENLEFSPQTIQNYTLRLQNIPITIDNDNMMWDEFFLK